MVVYVSWRPPHYFLPNFANSIGPIKVVQADEEELGGGAVHPRKIVVTRDVEADRLFSACPKHPPDVFVRQASPCLCRMPWPSLPWIRHHQTLDH